QPRLTLDWNPWSFSVRVFHSHCRYSRQHSHFCYLQQTSQSTFIGLQNAPLPRIINYASAASAYRFSPVTSSAQADSTSELLRFLQRAAASQPTSQLSLPALVVSHFTLLSRPSLTAREYCPVA